MAQTGAVSVGSLEEMAEIAMTFLYVAPPPTKRVAVLSLGGGASVAAADICCREGLEVPTLTQKTQTQLKQFVPLAGASIRNPLDTGLVFRDVSLLKRETELVAADPLIDALIVMPFLNMVRSAGPNQLERLVDYLGNFGRGKCLW